MFPLPEIAFGAVIAACISLLSLIISKEQKTSEFRQAWIDDLRTEIADLITHINAIHGARITHSTNQTGPEELWKIVREDYIGANAATAKIRLRLNPSEKESQTILSSIRQLEPIINSGAPNNANDINTIEKKLVEDAQILLKQEWLKVREGESVFKKTKTITKTILIIFSITLILYALANLIKTIT